MTCGDVVILSSAGLLTATCPCSEEKDAGRLRLEALAWVNGIPVPML
jgi:hypothetical protein